jgi:site-specific recombinase XerD
MKFAALIEEYIAFKRAKGMRFKSQAVILKQFSRRIGPVDVRRVSSRAVDAYLYRSETITTSWHQTYSTLARLYQYAITRGYTKSSPLPMTVPKKPKYARPYIYSVEELRKLLDSSAILDSKHKLGEFSVSTFRTLLLLLYGAGLRSNEAVSLTIEDVNLPERLLIVRDSKFFKSRLVPIGPKLTAVLQDYLKKRRETYGHPLSAASFFLNYQGESFPQQTAERYFRFVREETGIKRTDGAYYQPRLHDLRASFAVHRLVSWYQQGANVQKLLPQLSTYLGHVGIAETSVYLTMTPERLREANRRFENYAIGEVRHAA